MEFHTISTWSISLKILISIYIYDIKSNFKKIYLDLPINNTKKKKILQDSVQFI